MSNSHYNLDEIEAFTRIRFWQYLNSARHSVNVPEMEKLCGVCNGMVSVLYDLNSRDAYSKLKGLNKFRKIMRDRFKEHNRVVLDGMLNYRNIV